jgi:riboflavin biosynthesis pyrimidine reductase
MRTLLGDRDGADEPHQLYAAARPARPDRPWLVANMVAGLDGSAAVGGRVATLSSPRDRELFVLLRSIADIVLVGAGTVRAERYGPVRLPPEQRLARTERGQQELPPIAVVSRSLRFDFDGPLFATDGPPAPILLTAASAGSDALARARRHAEVVVAGDQRVDLSAALAQLKDRGVEVALTEGGPALLSELIEGALLDELCLTLAPVMGGDPLPVAQPSGGQLRRFGLASVVEGDSDLFLRYLAVER